MEITIYINTGGVRLCAGFGATDWWRVRLHPRRTVFHGCLRRESPGEHFAKPSKEED